MDNRYNNRTEESWSEGDYYGCTPLPLMINATVHEQPADLATVNARYTISAVDFVTQSLAAKQKFFLYPLRHCLCCSFELIGSLCAEEKLEWIGSIPTGCSRF